MNPKHAILLFALSLQACGSSSDVNPYEQAAAIARQAAPVEQNQIFEPLKNNDRLENKRWVVSGVEMDPPGMIILDIASGGEFSMDVRRLENAATAVFEAEDGMVKAGEGAFSARASTNSRALKDFAAFSFVTADDGTIYLRNQTKTYRIDELKVGIKGNPR